VHPSAHPSYADERQCLPESIITSLGCYCPRDGLHNSLTSTENATAAVLAVDRRFAGVADKPRRALVLLAAPIVG